VGDLGDAHGDLAVVDEQHVTRAAVPRQALEGGGDALAGALDVLGGDGEGLADLELVRTVGEPAQADLRALEVDQDGDVLPEVLGGPADVRVHLRVIVVRAVAEIHPGDVHPGFDQSADLLVGTGCGTQCADDLRFAHVNPSVVRVRAAFPPEQRARRRRAAASRVFALVFHIVTGFSPGLTGRGSVVDPVRCASTAAAQLRPSAIAHTMRLWPRAQSPAVNTPGTLVDQSASCTTVPREVRSAPRASSRPSRRGPVKPMAIRTRAAGSTVSVPGVGIRAPSRYWVRATTSPSTAPSASTRKPVVVAR